MKHDVNPIDRTQRMRDAARCHAKAKSTGQACKAPAVKGWTVCRVHGAGGGAPTGAAHPNYRHGGRTKEMELLRRLGSDLARMARDAANSLAS